MRPFWLSLCAVGLWALAEVPATAAWDNVFQPTLFHRFRRNRTTTNYAPVVAASVPVVAAPTCATCNTPPPVVAQASPAPCVQQQCSTSYSLRTYYQPVTTYQTQTVVEPVTTYRTSYYNEPVTSYRMSCYVDPCTGCSQQVAVPVTTYQLRAQTCPTQSWVSRCVQVPVQSVQKVCYWQPQTTCCTTTPGQPIYAGDGSGPPPSGAAQVPVQPALPQTPPPPSVSVAPSITQPGTANYPPPSVDLSRTPGNGTSSPAYDRYYGGQTPPPPAAHPTMPPASWQPQPGIARPAGAQPPPPPVKLDRIVVGPDARVEGQVVRSDNAPKGNAKLTFVNAAQGRRATITANPAGRFNVALPPGSWLVYLYGADDLPVYHSRLDVNPARPAAPITLVSNTR